MSSREQKIAAAVERALELTRGGQHAKAAREYERVLKLGLRTAAVYNNLGGALARAGEFSRATRALEKALRLDPQQPEAIKNLEELTRHAQAGALNEKATLSVCMIVRNEEKYLPDCLRSIKGLADEVIVVDTGSTDSTVGVAKATGAKVFFFAWISDFAAARNESLRHATCDWILWLDADDRLDEVSKTEIRWLILGPRNRALMFTLRNEGSCIGTSVVQQIRLFPNLPGLRFDGRVHETVHESLRELHLGVAKTDVTVVHIGYAIEAGEMRAKMSRNIKLLEAEAAAHPKDYRILLYLAGTSAALDDKRRHLEICRRMLADSDCTGPWRAMALTNLAADQVAARDFAKAARQLEEARDLLPTHPQIIVSLAECYFHLGRREETYRMMSEVLDRPLEVGLVPVIVESVYALAYYYLGCCAEEAGHSGEALRHYQKALEQKARFLACLLRIGALLLRLGHYQAAEQALLQAVHAEPGCAEARLNLGNARAALERLVEAESDYREALRLEPTSIDASINLANLLALQKRFEESEQIFRAILSASPRHPSVWHNFGCLCFERGRYGEAVEAHRKALDLGMNLPVVRQAIARAEEQDKARAAVPSA